LVEQTNAVQRSEYLTITSTANHKHNIPTRKKALHPNESLGRGKINTKNKGKVEHEEANWRTNPCGFCDESTDGLLDAHNGAKEEESLQVQDSRLLRDLAKVCTMGTWSAHGRQGCFSCVHHTYAASL
jgi:hypothetical protein